MEELRLYTFINFYLSPIQQGIQTAHVLGELFNTYDAVEPTAAQEMLIEWNRNHKTIIILNGGTDVDIRKLSEELHRQNQFPWEEFHEDEGLSFARTGVGVVLPQRVFDVRLNTSGMEDNYTAWYESTIVNSDGSSTRHIFDEKDPLYEFIRLLKSKRLA